MSKLTLNDLRLDVRIGCTEAERAKPQPISISVELWFDSVVPGVRTNRLEDTVCYGTLARRIRALIESQEFCLIEYLAGQVHEVASEMVVDSQAKPVLIEVVVKKLMLPALGLKGGASFTYRAVSSKPKQIKN